MSLTTSDNGLQFINAQGEPDVLSLGELQCVELTPNCSFQDYAGRPTYPSDQRPWISIYQHRDTTSVYDAIWRITLHGLTLGQKHGHFWTTREEEVMDRLKERQVPFAYWPKILGRSHASVERRAKKMFHQ